MARKRKKARRAPSGPKEKGVQVVQSVNVTVDAGAGFMNEADRALRNLRRPIRP